MKYFTSRSPADAPEDPWGKVTDPDGVERDRSEFGERVAYISDLADEISWLYSLDVGRQAPVRCLDIGCGPGWLLSRLPKHWLKHGVEPDHDAAMAAARHASLYKTSFEELALPANAYDVIICHHVIEHMYQPVEAVQEMWRLLEPGGYLLLATPDFDSDCAEMFGTRYRMLHDPTHISLFTEDSCRRLLQDTGFHVQRVGRPYFKTRHFTRENLLRLLDHQSAEVSPPAPGNWLTFYCRKPMRAEEYKRLMRQARELEV